MNNLRPFDLPYATKKGYRYAMLEKLDKIWEAYNAFRKKHLYTWYYLAHKIEKDNAVRAEYESLVSKAEALCTEYPNPMTKSLLGNIYRFCCKTEYTLKAVNLFEESAAEEYPEAMCRIADCYNRGSKYKQDYKKAAELYSKAAEAGSLEAKARLGDMYFFGDGVPKSIERAFKLYSESYDNGANHYAVEGLAFIYLYADKYNYKKDIREARRLYESIHDKSVESIKLMGMSYLAEFTEKPSDATAIGYLEKAGHLGNESAAMTLMHIYSPQNDKFKANHPSPEKHAYWKKRYNTLHGYYRHYTDGRMGVSQARSRFTTILYIAIWIGVVIIGWNILGWIWDFIVSIPNRILGIIY